jgi:hypothetical protein
LNTFENDCDLAVGCLKAAFIDLYDSIGADPEKPQEVSRSLKLNKTLTWKIAKLMQSNSGIDAVMHIPGVSAIEKMLKVSSRHGASDDVVDAVRDAAREFEQMIDVHVGDRATLDLIIDGLGTNGNQGLEQSRKRAFLGNTGIYGVQAKTHLKSFYVAPNADDPTMLDIASVLGYVGLRRLRSNIRIPLFGLRQWKESGEMLEDGQRSPLVAGASTPFLKDFCNDDLPEISTLQAKGGMDYVIQPGPIGNRSAFDCFYADKAPAKWPRYRNEEESIGEFSLKTVAPTDQMIIDLIVHKDMPEVLTSKSFVYAHFFTDEEKQGSWNESSLLPIDQSPVRLVGEPPAVATPSVPRYTELTALVYEQMGWNPKDFRGIRLAMKYPPLGSTTVLRFKLSDPDPAPAEGSQK